MMLQAALSALLTLVAVEPSAMTGTISVVRQGPTVGVELRAESGDRVKLKGTFTNELKRLNSYRVWVSGTLLDRTLEVEKYNLLAIPVVDDARHLAGIITHDDVIDVVREELEEDAQRIAAVAPLEDSFLDVGLMMLSWKRGIWLTILFFAALLTAFALFHYDQELAQYEWLVWFIPLIISAGGNSGSQSATLVITAMTSGDVDFLDWPKVMRREVIVALTLGSFLALIGYTVAFFLAPSPADALVIPLTLILVIFVGCVCGGALPMIFKRLGLDPAMMSNPFVAGIVDILGIVIYINVARLLLIAPS